MNHSDPLAYPEKDTITALIVDDSPDSLGMLNNALSAQGMTVLVALGGLQALNIIKQITPDIVLLDAVMPDIDGFETCSEIKKANPNLPVIFMTGLTETTDIVRGLEAGAVDYITKPINTKEAIARLKVHVHNARRLFSAKAALDSADQSIIAIDSLGNILWATNRAQTQLDQYQQDTFKLSSDLHTALKEHWLMDPNTTIQIEGFDHKQVVTASYLNKLGAQHLIRLAGNSQNTDSKKLAEKLPVTQREAEVLLWLSKGKSNWDIATILGIKPRTINKHLEQIFKKLEVDNRTAAAGIVIEVFSAES